MNKINIYEHIIRWIARITSAGILIVANIVIYKILCSRFTYDYTKNSFIPVGYDWSFFAILIPFVLFSLFVISSIWLISSVKFLKSTGGYDSGPINEENSKLLLFLSIIT